jgi:glycosyltransferase involved in cell wall biosynthesis
MPELIDDARTGFLVNDVDEAVLAVSRAATLDRCAVRQDAVARFGRDRMVDAYLEVYERVVSAEH